jgi:hypothetical protein
LSDSEWAPDQIEELPTVSAIFKWEGDGLSIEGMKRSNGPKVFGPARPTKVLLKAVRIRYKE